MGLKVVPWAPEAEVHHAFAVAALLARGELVAGE
jgi:hypothetical protein